MKSNYQNESKQQIRSNINNVMVQKHFFCEVEMAYPNERTLMISNLQQENQH